MKKCSTTYTKYIRYFAPNNELKSSITCDVNHKINKELNEVIDTASLF